MHTNQSIIAGHAHRCALLYDDMLLRQIIEVELDTWKEGRRLTGYERKMPSVDSIVRSIEPLIEKELCIHRFIPNHLIAMIHDSIRTLCES